MKKKSPKRTVPALNRVSLKFQLPGASSVALSGSFPFSNWDEKGVALVPTGGGAWTIDLELPPGRYEYRLIVDGEWRDAPDSVETVDNSFGGRNAVLVVRPPA